MLFRIAIFLALALGVAADVYACSCGALPKNKNQVLELTEEAGLVMLARIEEASVRTWAVGEEVQSQATARVTVVEGFKGVATGLEIIIDTDRTTCAADLNVRNTYLIFAFGPIPGGLYQTNLCQAILYESIDRGLPEYHEGLKDRVKMILETLREIQ